VIAGIGLASNGRDLLLLNTPVKHSDRVLLWQSSTTKSAFGPRSKLAIIKEYASAYATIMEAQRRKSIPSLRWIYIDAYAGPGYHLSKTSGELVDGSPLIALKTNPPFFEYHFIDTEERRTEQLRKLAGEWKDVFTYCEDCNTVLLRDVFPRARYEEYRRALCLLDPYNINLTWQVIEAAGKASSMEIFMNRMIMDTNRNAMRRNPDKSIQSKMDQLTRLWGDESWREAGYATDRNLFDEPEKVSNEEFSEAFRQRLQSKAGFKYVPPPMPMQTKSNSTIYYLYFASQKPVAAGVVNDIFKKYREKQGL